MLQAEFLYFSSDVEFGWLCSESSRDIEEYPERHLENQSFKYFFLERIDLALLAGPTPHSMLLPEA